MYKRQSLSSGFLCHQASCTRDCNITARNFNSNVFIPLFCFLLLFTPRFRTITQKQELLGRISSRIPTNFILNCSANGYTEHLESVGLSQKQDMLVELSPEYFKRLCHIHVPSNMFLNYFYTKYVCTYTHIDLSLIHI